MSTIWESQPEARAAVLPPADTVASFRVGRASTPALADHGVRGATILPGALYLELALRAAGPSAQRITAVEFHQPVVLAERDVELDATLTGVDSPRIRAVFREAGEPPMLNQPCASLEIEQGEPADLPADIAPDAFRSGQAGRMDAEEFYQRLNETGNQYGPRFRGLRELWRFEQIVHARLSLPAEPEAPEAFHLHPVAVDSAIQSLMAFGLGRGRTLVLRAIESVTFRRTGHARTGWISAALKSDTAANDEVVGNVAVYDDLGACWLQLRGVKLTAHEPAEGAASRPTKIVVAATFTAEPIAEVLRFWSETLSFPLQTSFAPYNQVFQELLDSWSAFRRNRDGCNVILLNLADWAARRTTLPPPAEAQKRFARFPDLPRHTLPHGLEVAHLNRHETNYVYREIFIDRCYLRHGIRLHDAKTVIDIGANIGLFSLFVRSEAPSATVFAYEPSPAAFRMLQANCEAYGPGLHAFNLGVAQRRGEAALTCYETSSVFSSFHADPAEDRRAIQAIAANIIREESHASAEFATEVAQELVTDRLKSRTVVCPLVSISDIIREHGLRRIDLLKIDAEKCEWEILQGVDEAHWPLIAQLVIEVHDPTRALLKQVREFLTERGFSCAADTEALLTDSGLFNVYATRPAPVPVDVPAADNLPEDLAEVRRSADDFLQVLEGFVRATQIPTVLCLCPPVTGEPGGVAPEALAQIEWDLLRRARRLPYVHALGSEEILTRYQAGDFAVPRAHELGHVPYTTEGFAAIGTSLFRLISGVRRPPFKVIALDCDHTLWQGVCGEDGAQGVVVTPAHRALQGFMVRQMEAGMLLCLCSKNHEADVWAVFEQNPEMVLERGHLAATRINWAPKSENLRSLAAELNVSPDSIIFLDDSPAECAEVRAHCPAVLALTLPTKISRIPHFLNHVWAFDHFGLTAEDRGRTRLMAENRVREKSRAAAPTLQEFIDGLDLRVNTFAANDALAGRLAQLTLRTNQFNFSGTRRTEGEILTLLKKPAWRCLAINVADRFGEYGVVGALLYEIRGDVYHVDTFLLSCRTLGRGVEHRVLAELGRSAQDHGKAWVDFVFQPSDKNQPAADFLKSLPAEVPAGEPAGKSIYRLSASALAKLRFTPDSSRPAPPAGSAHATTRSAADAESRRRPSLEALEATAEKLDDAAKIAAAIEARRFPAANPSAEPTPVVPPDTLAGKMLAIWRKVLGNPRLGLDDKFMEAGGTSLSAVQVVAALRKELQLPVSVVAFFECPTVRLLSEKFDPAPPPAPAPGEAIARGARRARLVKRRGRLPQPAAHGQGETT